MEKIMLDGVRLYRDLRDHFGTMKASYNDTWHLVPESLVDAILAGLDTAWSQCDYDHIIELALDEGFDLDQYRM